jgi:hypothetical protein
METGLSKTIPSMFQSPVLLEEGFHSSRAPENRGLANDRTSRQLNAILGKWYQQKLMITVCQETCGV